MDTHLYDKELLSFFSQMIKDEFEIKILEEVLSDYSDDEIIKNFIDSIKGKEND